MSKDNGGPASDKIRKARRAAFDNWYASRYGEVDRYNTLAMAAMYDALEVFNAALDCVVIELPKLPGEMNSLSPWVKGYEVCIKDSCAAIESTNLGIKVK